VAGPYIPKADAAALAWMKNFRDLIGRNYATYGLDAGDAQAVRDAVDPFEAAYATAQAPATRTRPNVAAKDAARRAAEATCRRYAQMLRTNVALTAQQKTALGLSVGSASHGPIAPPDTSPLLTIIAATPLAHTLRYADAAAPARRAKPAGAMQLQLHRAVGPAAAKNPEQAAFYRAFTRQPLEVTFSPADQGQVATYFARWATRTGAVGPWSLPVHMTVAGGSTVGAVRTDPTT
jgi:hypothetical protein